MTMKQILIDLQEIRYYYAHKNMFDKACGSVGKNTIVEKVGKYNAVMHDAPPRLYALYVALLKAEIGNSRPLALTSRVLTFINILAVKKNERNIEKLIQPVR